MVGYKQEVNGGQNLKNQKIECFYAVLNEKKGTVLNHNEELV